MNAFYYAPRRPFGEEGGRNRTWRGPAPALSTYDRWVTRTVRQKYPWWVLVFAILGFISLCTVLVTLFSPLGRRPPEVRITAAPPVRSPEFLAAVAGAAGAPVRAGGTVQLLNNGVTFFPALRAAERTRCNQNPRRVCAQCRDQ
jgi:hypothetical protein